MADPSRKAADNVDMAPMFKIKDTNEVMKAAAEVRASRKAYNDKSNKEYKFPSTYNPKMGLKQGSITELRMFFHVIPGHAEALKEELAKFKEKEERQSKLVHLMTGIRTMTCTLFDNDRQYLHTTEFDNDWDPYIEDALPTDYNRLMYALWFQHLEEAKEFGPDNLPTANDVKVLFNKCRVTAVQYLRTFDKSNLETYKMMDIQEAFEKVLEHPDAAKALEHPALKPLLDLAAAG